MQPKLGIVAGGGELPVRLVAACRQQGRDFFLVGLSGHANPDDFPDDVPQAWYRIGAAGKIVDELREQGCQDIVMAGPVRRPSLPELRPDWKTVRFFSRIGLKALGDDGLLKAVIDEFERDGFRVVGAHTVLDDLLAESGVWGRYQPDEQAQVDITHGLKIASALGGLDVGQSVVVQQGIVLGVEAVEGTEALLARCGTLRREGDGGVLVKISKPGQERRVDLPTIGPKTIASCVSAGLRGIAVETGATIVINRDAVIAAADQAGLFICGVVVPS